MDNWNPEKRKSNDETDKELIGLNKLQMLETFARAASQIRENLRHREQMKLVQYTLSHGTKEPLQIIRMYLEVLKLEESPEKQSEILKKTDAHLEMLQSTFQLLVNIEKGTGNVKLKDENISEILKKQMELYKSYASQYEGVK